MSPLPDHLPDGRPLPHGQGRSLPPTPAFAGDDGSTDPALAEALAAGDGLDRLRAVVTALATARVLVPVVSYVEEEAESIEREVNGATVQVTGEKSASAAMVTLATPDGRAAIPVFSGMDALRARSEEHTSELQSRGHLVCRLLLEKKKEKTQKLAQL